MNTFKRVAGQALGHGGVVAAKKLWYGRRGEPIRLGPHFLRYVPGTRPVRLQHRDHPTGTVRNDARQLQFFLDRVRRGDFALDVGGHMGQYAVLLGKLVGAEGRAISFEPDHDALPVLRRNLQLNGLSRRVRVEEVALSDRAGTHLFFSHGGNSMSSLARSGLGGGQPMPGATESTVRTETLDGYLAARGLGFPQWIKIDTEGAEVSILRGARETLRSGAVIACELHPCAWDEFGTSFGELLEIVRGCGRAIKYLDGSMRIEDGPQYGAAIIS